MEHYTTKQKFFHDMFNDYKTVLKDKTNTKRNKLWSESIDHILTMADNVNLQQRKALGLLKDYYVTGNEKSYQEYITITQETDQLNHDVEKLVKETF